MTIAMQEVPRDPKATKVLIRGMLFPLSEKAPFTPSGHSVFGGLVVSEDEKQVLCHECGQWHHDIHGRHLKQYGLTKQEYRKKHGLRMSTSLVSPAKRKAHSEEMKRRWADPELRIRMLAALATSLPKAVHARKQQTAQDGRGNPAEGKNLTMNCRAQIEMGLLNLALKLGRVPTTKEREAAGIYHRAIEWAFGMTVRETLRAIGLTPNPTGRQRIAAPIELAILQMRARGRTFGEIASALCIAQATAFQYCKGKIAPRTRGWKLSAKTCLDRSIQSRARMQDPATRKKFVAARWAERRSQTNNPAGGSSGSQKHPDS